MGFKEKLTQRYTKSYLKKYGDRLTQVQGNVVSVKVETKTILWIYHKLFVTVVVRPERSKSIVKCTYERKRCFKKPEFMSITQGNLLIIQGLKGKKGKEKREVIQIMNVMNLTTHKDLVKTDNKPKRVQKVQRIK
jgi:hypothetical protein